jgi:hypothetical protein
MRIPAPASSTTAREKRRHKATMVSSQSIIETIHRNQRVREQQTWQQQEHHS